MNGLRCRPGDLAVIVQDADPARDIGRFVLVKSFEFDSDGTACWSCDSVAGKLRWWDGVRFRYAKRGIQIPDAWLRPIRDTGDDAVDEMTLLAGKPEGVTA